MTESTNGARVVEPQRLADRYPEELKFFKDVFLWGGSTAACYVSSFYENQDMGGLTVPKWQPLKTRGNYQKLYGALVDSLAEKHLDFANFCCTASNKDRIAPRNWETAFWVGTMAGPRTRTHAIDIDLHDRIGWYCVPTRWHSSRTGNVEGPHAYRDIPVVRPSLRFYMTAKLVYDAFAGRIWSFSSGTLGFAVWDVFSRSLPTQSVYDQVSARLKTIGLPQIEHYPLPSGTGSLLGRCHRRPCGIDSGIITSEGLVADPVQQIRCFMQRPETPSFGQVVRQHIRALVRSYRAFLRFGESVDHKRLSPQEKVRLIKECCGVVEEVKRWLNYGCQVDLDAVRQGEPHTDSSPELYTHLVNSTVEGDEYKEEREGHRSSGDVYPDSFWHVDLPRIIEQGQWLQFVNFLVTHGFPAEDKFYDVISTLAKWFLFVEHFGQDKSKTVELLSTYVHRRHNGKISRLGSGDLADIDGQILRIVKSVSRSTEGESAFFEDIRRRRAMQRYAKIWNFAGQILGETPLLRTEIEAAPVEGPPTATIQQGNNKSEWRYVPDDTPLPDFAVQRIRAEFKAAGRQIRKRNGKYPVLEAITRFVNYLLSGHNPGQRRCSQDLLVQMGFNSRGKDRDAVMNLLVKAGLISKGNYVAHSRSRMWLLTGPDRYLAHRRTMP